MAKTLKDNDVCIFIIERKNPSDTKQTAHKNSKIVKKDNPKLIIKSYKDGHVIAEYSGMDMPRCISDTRLQERRHREIEKQMKESIVKLYDLDTIYSSSLDCFSSRKKLNELKKLSIHNDYSVQYATSMQSIWKKVGGYISDAIKGSEEKLVNEIEW